MGWSTGSSLFSDVISILKDKIEDDVQREDLYYDLIEAFENYDCDTLDECKGEDKAFDRAYKQYVKDNFDIDDDEDEEEEDY